MPFLAILSFCLAAVSGASAHEYWIAPTEYVIAPGVPLAAHLRVGQGMTGIDQVYLPRGFTRFEIAGPEVTEAVTGRVGDRPAIYQVPPDEGLVAVIFESVERSLSWKALEDFAAFVEAHDLGDAIAAHGARGLPEAGFDEVYTRHAKALVSVGEGSGADRAFGMPVEIVALANPYEGTPQALPVRLLEGGAPRPDAQLEMFVRAAGTKDAIEPVRLRSDADGVVRVPLTPGTEVMLNFVVLRPDAGAAPWRSLWASLTFAVPAR